ncbi:MAG: fibronectin type III domain-containing protein [Ruminococcus sp.]|nr:fibronectin type III domain-containing protein [Ruminococcus sp.]
MKKAVSFILCIVALFGCTFAVFGETGEAVTSAAQEKKEIEVEQVKAAKQTDASYASVTLKWKAVSGADGYRVYQYDEKEDNYAIAVKSTSETTAEIKGLKAGASFNFKVRAYAKNDSGKTVWGKPSDDIAASTAPGTVTGITTTDIELDSITISWKAVTGANGYQVYIYDREREKFVLCGSSDSNSFTCGKLESNRLYTFKVRAFRNETGFKAIGELGNAFSEFTHKKGAPITNAQAAKIYNTAVNKAKQRTDMTVKYSKEIQTKAVSCSKQSLFSTVSNQMNLHDGKITQDYTFASNRWSSTKPNDIIEPMGKDSAVRGCDIKSFAYENKDGVVTLKIVLVSEKANYDGKTTALPSRNKRVMSSVKLQSIVTKPIKVKNAVQTYQGTTLTVKAKGGELTALSLKSPVKVDANCKVSTLSFKTTVNYTVIEKYTFINGYK